MVCVSVDRARVVGGLPDVVTIQEGKVIQSIIYVLCIIFCKEFIDNVV